VLQSFFSLSPNVLNEVAISEILFLRKDESNGGSTGFACFDNEMMDKVRYPFGPDRD
jgi:hypothetical protein